MLQSHFWSRWFHDFPIRLHCRACGSRRLSQDPPFADPMPPMHGKHAGFLHFLPQNHFLRECFGLVSGVHFFGFVSSGTSPARIAS